MDARANDTATEMSVLAVETLQKELAEARRNNLYGHIQIVVGVQGGIPETIQAERRRVVKHNRQKYQ